MRQVKPGTDILQSFAEMELYLAECCIEEMDIKLPLEVFDICHSPDAAQKVIPMGSSNIEKPLSARDFFLLKIVCRMMD